MTTSGPEQDRLLELLVQDWEGELSVGERRELQRLSELHPGEREAWEATAVATHVAFTDPSSPPLPEHVRARILDGAGPHLPAPIVSLQAQPTPTAVSLWPWGVAAVAAGLAFVLGQSVPGTEDPEASVDPLAQSAEARLNDLLADTASAQRLPWTKTEDAYLEARTVTGEVVWSETEQRGFMVFEGLPPNDPSRHQYQLWIFDATRDERFPVDGGVFDIPAADGTVVVPITPKLPVGRAALFAVTLERPGGVVVSDREHILTMAKPPSS
ncbi:MAG: anti-sigma factor domain-containing protein [Myxococcota bacterium]